MFAKAGFIAGSADGFEHAQKIEEDGFEKMPVLSPAGEEGAKPKLVAFGFVNIDDGEIALTAGGNIKAKTIGASGREDFIERTPEERFDLGFAGILASGAEIAELLPDLFGFEVHARDGVVGTALFDAGPVNDVIGGGAQRVAHVGLFEDAVIPGAGPAISEETVAGEFGSFGAIHRFDEAIVNGVLHGDAEVEVSGIGGGGGVNWVNWVN